MAKTSKATVKINCLKAWMTENKFPKVKLQTTNILTNYDKR